MRNLSIRLKLTLWFSLFLALVVGLTFASLLYASDAVLQKGLRDALIVTVENNIDEIEFMQEIVESNRDTDLYLDYRGGYLEVDDDFLNEVNGVYTALYHVTDGLIYGENPIAQASAELAFTDTALRTCKSGGVTYYVLDRRLTRDGLQGLWLRGVLSSEQGTAQVTDIARLALLLSPLLLVLAVCGGYVLAGRLLRPVRRIEQTAREITDSCDLERRIALPGGKDELHRLADTFDEMLSRLEQSVASERRFLSDASHELRTPTAVILAQCEASLSEKLSGEEYAEALRVVQRQGKKLSRLVDDLLTVTRLTQRAQVYPMAEVELSELTRSLCAELALLREQGITLTVQADEGVRVRGSEELLRRALGNLISNAYRYGRENGTITVTLRAQGAHALLCVADDGIGIAEQELSHVFERFYCVDSARGGAGIGLSMVREIALFHGGEVTLESAPGRGSRFTIRLPKK